MNDSAWERLTDAIDTKLGIDKHGRLERPIEDRPDLTERVQFIEFERDGTRFKLEHITGPAIIDRKTHYSARPGAANRVEVIDDPHEQGQRVEFFRDDNGNWTKLDPSSLQV